MYIHMYTHTYVCTYIRIRMYTHMYVHTHIHIYVCTYTCMHVRLTGILESVEIMFKASANKCIKTGRQFHKCALRMAHILAHHVHCTMGKIST